MASVKTVSFKFSSGAMFRKMERSLNTGLETASSATLASWIFRMMLLGTHFSPVLIAPTSG